MGLGVTIFQKFFFDNILTRFITISTEKYGSAQETKEAMRLGGCGIVG